MATATVASSYVLRASNARVAWELKPLEPLPASAEEVRVIAALYRSSRKAPTDVWEERQAGESRLKALAQAPTVLHLSTHGFYLVSATPGTDIDWHKEQPWLLSGLALAGANAGLQGQVGPDGEDGILYSLEILRAAIARHGAGGPVCVQDGPGRAGLFGRGVWPGPGLSDCWRTCGPNDLVGGGGSRLQGIHGGLLQARLQQNRSDCSALRHTKLDYIRAKRAPQLWAPYVLISGR